MPYLIKVFFVVAMGLMSVALAYWLIHMPGVIIALILTATFHGWVFSRNNQSF
jgi:hypothetical protein